MYFRLIACNVLTREVGWCAANCPNTLDIVFLPKDEHNVPARLREALQAEIDKTACAKPAYDAVLLGYGLCGNATVGLRAGSCPLVIPRAHDCTTLFLGSKEKFKERFGENPSQPWTSLGYAERGDTLISDGNARIFGEGNMSFAELVDTYGEENAQYIIQALSVGSESDDLPFLDVPETHLPELTDKLLKRIADMGKTPVCISGSIKLIEGLLSGNWPEDKFLVVPPNHCITGVYDHARVVEARKDDSK